MIKKHKCAQIKTYKCFCFSKASRLNEIISRLNDLKNIVLEKHKNSVKISSQLMTYLLILTTL